MSQIKSETYKGYYIVFQRFNKGEYTGLKHSYTTADLYDKDKDYVYYPNTSDWVTVGPHAKYPKNTTTKSQAFEEMKKIIDKLPPLSKKPVSKPKDRFSQLMEDTFTYDDEWDLDMQVKAARGEIRDTKAPVTEKKAALSYLNKEYKEHKEGFE